MPKKQDKTHVPPMRFVKPDGWDIMGGNPPMKTSPAQPCKMFIPGQRLNLGLTRRP